VIILIISKRDRYTHKIMNIYMTQTKTLTLVYGSPVHTIPKFSSKLNYGHESQLGTRVQDVSTDWLIVSNNMTWPDLARIQHTSLPPPTHLLPTGHPGTPSHSSRHHFPSPHSASVLSPIRIDKLQATLLWCNLSLDVYRVNDCTSKNNRRGISAIIEAFHNHWPVIAVIITIRAT
jgi:hypothetical protein